MQHDYDVIIAGGGMVGASLALCLDHYSGGKLKVLVVESFALPPQGDDERPQYRPSFDARSTALAYGSRLVYERLGVWELLNEHSCPINSVQVSDRGHFGSVLMEAQQQGWDSLGYVIENAWLGNVLLNHLRRHTAVEFCSPATVTGVEMGDGLAQVTIQQGDEEKSFSTQLLAVADGADSGLRTGLGIAASVSDYHQSALIANIGTQRSHQGCAFERFTDRGPMAMLPLLPDESGGSRSALVWTFPSEDIDAAMAWSDEEFLANLQQRFGYRLGNLDKVGARACYPLKLTQASEQVRNNIAVVGNAAHFLHPVAGQGFNLALRDVAVLSEIVAAAHGRGEAFGELAVLKQYLNTQHRDQQITTVFSDKLTAIFSNRQPALSVARNLGLLALDIAQPMKSRFVAQTAGVSSNFN